MARMTHTINTIIKEREFILIVVGVSILNPSPIKLLRISFGARAQARVRRTLA
jgi:hypothetical protein